MIITAFESGIPMPPSPYPPPRDRHDVGRRSKTGTLTKTMVMKLAVFLLSVFFFQAHGNSYAQKVTLSGKEITLKQVFAAIEKQTDYVVFSNESFLAKAHKVSVTVHQASIETLLDLVLKDQPIEYSIRNKTIILSEKKAGDGANTPVVPQPEQSGVTINGMIRSSGSELLAGVSISIKGTSLGTTTDGKGNFSLRSQEESLVLQISMIGYEGGDMHIKKTDDGYRVMGVTGKLHFSADTKTAGQINLLVHLVPAVSGLDEMQVTAYGKTSRRLATSNIGTVKGEDIEKLPVTTALEALIGRVPGVVVEQYSGNGAAPVKVQIRGRKSLNATTLADPLYVVDGIPLLFLNASANTVGLGYSAGASQGGSTNTNGENPLLSINPRDIERIDVLQDADGTAIYGSRGANGVILITTRKAKAGPTTFTLTLNNGIKYNQKIPRTISTAEYLAVRREAFMNDGIDPNAVAAMDLKLWDTTKYTDWGRHLSGTGNVLTVNASLGGGNQQTSYRAAANFVSTKEIMNNGGKNNIGGVRLSINHTSNNQKFKVSFGSNLSLAAITAYGIGNFLATLPPNAPDLYTETGELNFAPWRTATGSRFVFGGLKRPSVSKTNAIQSQANLSYAIVNGLTLSMTGGYHFSHNQNSMMVPASSGDPLLGVPSRAVYGATVNKTWQVEPQVEYHTRIGKGNLRVQVIGTATNTTTLANTVNGVGYANESLMKSVMNADTKVYVENFLHYRYISGATILNYNWDNKYVLSLNGRRDGSSKFGPGKQFGNFGSIGLSWNISEEKWVRKVLPAWLSFVKLFGNTGVSGSDVIGDYEYLSRWGASYVAGSNTLLQRYNGMSALHVQRPLVQEYQWENLKQTNLSLDLGFWQDKVTLRVNAYRSRSHNKLTNIPIPLYTGFASYIGNSRAVVENSGLAIDISANLIQREDWGARLAFNIGTNKNVLADYPGLELSADRSRFKVGASLDAVYLMKYLGIDPLTGNYTFQDYNKDGIITLQNGSEFPTTDIDDRYILLNLAPRYQGGLTANLYYRQFSLNASMAFVNKMLPNPIYQDLPGTMTNFTIPEEVRNSHWQKPGDIVKYPRYTNTTSTLGQISMSDVYYMHVKYLRMTGLSLSYQLPDKYLQKAGVKHGTIGVNTGNLFTISNYKGFDPDITSAVARTPVPRSIVVDLTLTF